ncbi:dephospho-CoA kinase [Mesoflavibacter profundi]|uniref:dephospho-CoA kinase n=1 Tax=Mesoflavibacter profundi TaxID=2708110 RepID=UPI00351173E1
MTKLVGLTGGIGSGKTTVAKYFEELGVPVYIADLEAKALMNRSKVIRRKLIALFGNEAYLENTLNRPFIAQQIFNDKKLLNAMNAIVHPKVASHFKRWVNKQDSPYVISEAAILFENGSYKKYDYIITVTAPEHIRLQRVIKRDNSNKQKVEAIMANQWSDQEKIKRSDFVIENIDLEQTKIQVRKIHKKILKLTSKH